MSSSHSFQILRMSQEKPHLPSHHKSRTWLTVWDAIEESYPSHGKKYGKARYFLLELRLHRNRNANSHNPHEPTKQMCHTEEQCHTLLSLLHIDGPDSESDQCNLCIWMLLTIATATITWYNEGPYTTPSLIHKLSSYDSGCQLHLIHMYTER